MLRGRRSERHNRLGLLLCLPPSLVGGTRGVLRHFAYSINGSVARRRSLLNHQPLGAARYFRTSLAQLYRVELRALGRRGFFIVLRILRRRWIHWYETLSAAATSCRMAQSLWNGDLAGYADLSNDGARSSIISPSSALPGHGLLPDMLSQIYYQTPSTRHLWIVVHASIVACQHVCVV